MRLLGLAVLLLGLVTAMAAPAAAQLLGGVPRIPMLPSASLPPLGETVDRIPGGRLASAAQLVRMESTRVLGRDLLRRNRTLLESDDQGHPIVRGQLIAIGLSDQALARAREAGFSVKALERLPGLDLETIVLTAPKGLNAPDALRRLRALDPAGQYDVNPIYFESGAGGAPSTPAARSVPPSGRALRIGLLDGAADPNMPALSRARLIQQAFAPGGTKVSPHGTAVASLLAGEDGAFRGAAPGATLYVADVYGPTASGGSAVDVVRGLAWLVESNVPVINVSLVGPPNTLLEAAVSRAIARGHIVVAAVGNDGPAAPPLYPAAYAGVVGVTGLDARLRVLPEAGRGPQVAFAAPGADMAAATAGGGYTAVRGTSYAAPLVAGLLARSLPQADPAAARRAVDALAHTASDLGPKGRDAIFGWGGVALDLPIRPAALAHR